MDKKKIRRSTARRKKRSVRLRWDRIFMVLILPVLLIILAVILVRGCDGPAPDTAPQSRTEPPLPHVSTVAERDAAAVTGHRPESMERQNALLNIHARHSALRRHGFNAAADEYINTVNKYLTEHGDN